MSNADYFTYAEYRERTGDTDAPYRVEDTDIARAHTEVINRLEKWARTAWPTLAPSIGTATCALDSDQLISASNIFLAADVGTDISLVTSAGLYYTLSVTAYTDATTVTVSGLGATHAAVTGTVRRPVAGYAITPRREVHTRILRDPGEPLILLPKLPILHIVSVYENDDEVTAADITNYSSDDYLADMAAGIIRWGDWCSWPRPTTDGPNKITITYDYGYTETPEEVKTPCVQAVETRLDSQEGRGRIPRNVTQYTTERTTFVFGMGVKPVVPWPWDANASEDIRSYWEETRPRGLMRIG